MTSLITPLKERDELIVALQIQSNERLEKLIAAHEAIRQILDVVNEQAEDDGLWAIHAEGTQPIAEAYLQQELRKLHAVIEFVTKGKRNE